MDAVQQAQGTPARGLFPNGSWRAAVWVAALALAARMAYLVWLCPYELAADEAHYWEWSRRPDLSYYSKGPGVAWTIAVARGVFGDSEWAVRLPAAIAGFLAALLLARLATHMHGGDGRVGFLAALLFLLCPVFHGTSQFMTIDGPYYACWLGAALLAWRLYRKPGSLAAFFGLGVILGVGLLFKYTILLLLPGLLLFFGRYRRAGAPGRYAADMGMMLAGLILSSSPVLVWNHQHGWPTVAHLIGHAGLPGGDVAAQQGWRWNPLWTLGYVFYPLVVLGPPAGLLVVSALRRTWRLRATGGDEWPAAAFALHTAAPIAIFYGLLSFRTDIELNWAVAGYTVLLAPAAGHLAGRYGGLPGARALWRWTVGVGLAFALIISFGKPALAALGRVSIGGKRLRTERLLARIDGHRELARRATELSAGIARTAGRTPFLVAANYSQAGLLAFYMEGHPSVRSAASLTGGRESSYDYFADTRLADPALLGRPALLLGANEHVWSEALRFERVEALDASARLYVGWNYGGPSREPRRR